MTAAEALVVCMRPPIVTRSLLVAVVVGVLLNAINQGDVLLAGESVDMAKLGLTFVVPFLVASFGSWSALRETGSDRDCD